MTFEQPQYLFAYGTLQEGNPAHALLMPHIIDSEPHTVRGRHVDTPYTFPTVKFDGDDLIEGTMYQLQGMTPEDWRRLDRYEAVHIGAYRRVKLVGHFGAYAYEWTFTDDRKDTSHDA